MTNVLQQEHNKNPDIIPHPLEEETFVNYDQESDTALL